MRIYQNHIIAVFSFLTVVILSINPAFTQSSEYEKATTFVQTPETAVIPDDETISESSSKTLGRVVEIEIGGQPSTRPSVILTQLTFEKGDVITTDDVALTYKRLHQIGLFWHVRIRYQNIDSLEIDSDDFEIQEGSIIENPDEIFNDENSNEIPDIIVYVEVWQAPSWYAYPYESGAIIGDKDFFLTGKTLEAAYFQSGKEFVYWHGRYVDPQFLGSHNVATLIFGHLEDLYGVRDEVNFDLSERYALNRSFAKFSIQTLHQEDYVVNFGLEWQENKTEFRNGTIFADTNKFFFSEEEYSPGNLFIFDVEISHNTSKGYPWTNSGYRWSLGTDQSLKGLGSDYTFGRYKALGSVYLPIDSMFLDTMLLHGKYETTSGNPTHYQKPRLGFLMRGHRGLDYFGDSTIFFSCELRKNFYDDIFQGIVFVDMGKGFDSRTVKLDNLDISAGVGLRADLSKIIRLNAIFRIDYGAGPSGDRWTFGIGQWIY